MKKEERTKLKMKKNFKHGIVFKTSWLSRRRRRIEIEYFSVLRERRNWNIFHEYCNVLSKHHLNDFLSSEWLLRHHNNAICLEKQKPLFSGTTLDKTKSLRLITKIICFFFVSVVQQINYHWNCSLFKNNNCYIILAKKK